MPTVPRSNGTVGKFGLQVRIRRAAGAVAVLAVAGLRHEAVDDAMERHVVIKSLARQLFESLGVSGRNVGVELDEDQTPGVVSRISVF